MIASITPKQKELNRRQLDALVKEVLQGNASLARLAAAQGQALGRIKLQVIEMAKTIRTSTFALPRELKITEALDDIATACGRSDEILDIKTDEQQQKPPDLKLAKPSDPDNKQS